MTDTQLTKKQSKVYGPRTISYEGRKVRITATVRHDDECNNGHNTFAITGWYDEFYDDRWHKDAGGGCCHEIIAKAFPELEPHIKWHLCSTDGPMHYMSAIYLAGERDYWGLLKGEASKSQRHQEFRIRFGNSPITHKIGKRFKEWVESDDKTNRIEAIENDDKRYKLRPKYAPTDWGVKEWYKCPFDSKREADEWMDAVFSGKGWNISQHPTLFGEGKARELDAARRCAIWPEATDEELTSPNLKKMLEDRLPAVMKDFRLAVESLGFTY